MSIHVFRQLESQFEMEFNFWSPLTWWFVDPNMASNTLKKEWPRIENKVIEMEMSHPILQIWNPHYDRLPGLWWAKPPTKTMVAPGDVRRIKAWSF